MSTFIIAVQFNVSKLCYFQLIFKNISISIGGGEGTVISTIIHIDYINGSYPVFEIYDDRIEMISFSLLPIGLTIDEFFNARSLPRNKELMRIFSDIELCEQLGSGLKKIMQYYTKDDFEISEQFIAVIFKYNEEALSILGVQNGTQKDE